MPHAQEELTLGFGCVGEQGPFRDVAGGEGGCGYLGEAEVGRDVATKIDQSFQSPPTCYCLSEFSFLLPGAPTALPTTSFRAFGSYVVIMCLAILLIEGRSLPLQDPGQDRVCSRCSKHTC